MAVALVVPSLWAAPIDMKCVGEVSLFFGEYEGGISDGWSMYLWPVNEDGRAHERTIGSGQTLGPRGPSGYFSECYIAIVSDCEVSNWTIRPLLSRHVGQYYQNVFGEPASFQGKRGRNPCLATGSLDMLSGAMLDKPVVVRMDEIGGRFAHYGLGEWQLLDIDVILNSDLLGGTKFKLLLLAK